jgi:membrane protein implicated in regulation of membrane protease activity
MGLEQLFETYQTAFWMTAGLLLIIAEMLLLPGFFISFAVAAFAMAGLSFLSLLNVSVLLELLIFMVIGTGLFLPTRWLLKKQEQATPDINQY